MSAGKGKANDLPLSFMADPVGQQTEGAAVWTRVLLLVWFFGRVVDKHELGTIVWSVDPRKNRN